VHAGIEVFQHFAVAHPTGLRHTFSEICRGGPGDLVGRTMTRPAIRCCGVAFPGLFPVNALCVRTCLSLMAGGALRFRQTFRVGRLLMFEVALGASDFRMR
jgi:hypothetical protein